MAQHDMLSHVGGIQKNNEHENKSEIEQDDACLSHLQTKIFCRSTKAKKGQLCWTVEEIKDKMYLFIFNLSYSDMQKKLNKINHT